MAANIPAKSPLSKARPPARLRFIASAPTLAPVIPRPLSTPPQLFREFECGRITRDQLHAALAWHARELIEEMIDEHLHPAAAWVEQLLARRAAAALIRKHGERRLRSILAALAESPGFPLARWLWNAPHPDVPLHCFLRIRREPVFRIRHITILNGCVRAAIDHGASRRNLTTREWITFGHGRDGSFVVTSRQPRT